MIINAYLRPLTRWWRLIAIVTLLAVVASSVSSMFQPVLYQSRTTLLVGTTFLDPNPSSGNISIAGQLAAIYADMALREPIQIATMEALGRSWLPQYQAEVIEGTQLLEITVTDTNPQLAQIIANELARQLTLQTPTIGGTETGERQEFIKQQLSNLQNQIQEIEKNKEDLQKSLIGLTSASQIANIEQKIVEESAKLDTLRTNYAGFLANSQEGATNILSVLEPANLPTSPISGNKLTIIFLAGLVGLSLGAGAAYLLEYLDRGIKTVADVDRIFGLPVIGFISQISENGSQASFISKNPDSLMAENFRMLRSNIEYFSVTDRIKTLMITSPNQGNGKTTIATNLALSISLLEQDVIIIDADLRRPSVHSTLKIARSPGLSDVIRNKADIQNVIRPWKKNKYLKVVTAGLKPPNITEVVGTKRILAILSKLKEEHELIIIDAPPLIIADTYNLAASADGVIIVLEPGHTTEEQARAIKEQLDRANAHILGIVFNKVSEGKVNSYGDYQYQALYSSKYYGDYASSPTKKPVTASRSKKLIDFFEHGAVPPEVTAEVGHAMSAIKKQPRSFLDRFRKSRKKS